MKHTQESNERKSETLIKLWQVNSYRNMMVDAQKKRWSNSSLEQRKAHGDKIRVIEKIKSF